MKMQTDNRYIGYKDPTAFPNSGISPESLALSGASEGGDVSRVQSILDKLPPQFPLTQPAEKYIARARFRSATHDLEDACSSGNLDKVRSVLDAWRVDPSLDDPTAEDMYPSLIHAAKGGKGSVVRFLLDEGVPMKNAPVYANAEGEDDDCLGVYQAFVDHGWDINSSDSPPLQTKMKSPSLVKWFLAHDADPNHASKIGHTPLDIAVQQDGISNSTRFALIDMILSAGGVLNQSETIHNAVCHIRSDTECIEMMEFLLAKGVDINALSFVNQPHRQPGWVESTALHWAVHRHQRRRMKKNMLVRVKWLLEHGADVSVKNSQGKTPLDEATDDALVELLNSGSST